MALFERHYDLVFSAIEHSFAPSTVVTKRVYSLERGLFASPGLLADHAPPEHPEELNALPLLGGSEDQGWSFTRRMAARRKWRCATRACAAAMRRSG